MISKAGATIATGWFYSFPDFLNFQSPTEADRTHSNSGLPSFLTPHKPLPTSYVFESIKIAWFTHFFYVKHMYKQNHNTLEQHHK
jgi:hypothetical protein